MKILPDKCPYYQGICGLDESFVCYCSSTYLVCKVYKEHKKEEND